MTNRIAISDYAHARAAGLTLLGGRDIWCQVDGLDVRGHFWAANANGAPAKGTVIFSPGFTEFCEKHSEPAAQWHARGYDVLLIDWPGQGMSGHFGRNPIAVHIDSFEIHLRAMDAMIAAAGIAEREVILMGHSMGGHLTLRLMERYADRVRGTILMSPMIAPPVMPVSGVRLLARLFRMAGLARSYPPMNRGVSLEVARFYWSGTVLSRWQPGFESQFIWIDDVPELYRSGPTAGWVKAAYDSCARYTLNAQWMRARTGPILALTAGDDTVIHKKSTDRMLPWLPNCTHHEYPDARHELLTELPEIQADLWQRIDAFLATLPAK